MMLTHPAIRLATLGVLLAFCGCSDENDAETDTDAEIDAETDTEAANPYLRAIHMVPDNVTLGQLEQGAPACDPTDDASVCLDLYAGDSTTSLNEADGPFPFSSSSGYNRVPLTGALQLHVVADGETNTPSNRLLTVDVTLAEGDVKTILIWGSTTNPFNADAIVIDGDLEEASSGNAKVRFFHSFVADPTAAPDISIGDTLVADGIAYGTLEPTDYIEVAAGDDLAITVDLDGDTIVDAAGQIDLTDGAVYDIVLVYSGVPAEPLLALAHDNESTTPQQVPIPPVTP